MSWIQAIQSMLPLPRSEHRSNQEIEDDLDAEIAFHLEQSTRDVMSEEDLPREAASGVARARFGDVESIKKRCRRIALEERIMLQRVNFVMMLVVLLIVVGVGVQVMITQRYNTLALQAITADLARMKFEVPSSNAATSLPQDNGTAHVLVHGSVPKPGWFPLTMDRLTDAGEVLKKAGCEERQWVSYRHGTQENTFALGKDFMGRMFVVLQPGDELIVFNDDQVGENRRRGYYVQALSSDCRDRAWSSTATAESPLTWQLVTSGVGSSEGLLKAVLKRTDGQMNLEGEMHERGFQFRAADGNMAVVPWDVQNDLLKFDFDSVQLGKAARNQRQPVADPNWPKRIEFDLAKEHRRDGEVLQSPSTAPDRADAESSTKSGFVFLDGDVKRPGVYNLPDMGNGLTIGRLIASAGGVTSTEPHLIQVMDGTNVGKWVWSSESPDKPQDYVLHAGDRAEVLPLDPAKGKALSTDRARADALYDFVKTLMTQVGPEHAGDQVRVRDVLDQMEAELPTKYPNNPDLQGLIREMIAGRRKILEYDERLPDAMPAATQPASP